MPLIIETATETYSLTIGAYVIPLFPWFRTSHEEVEKWREVVADWDYGPSSAGDAPDDPVTQHG
jgi:hypothetical protein